MDARSRRSAPEHCDLVMKGGITSGVVYPQAVLALKDRYRFRNIGGGSVGAVAAALTAAELGRTTENAHRSPVHHKGGFPGRTTERRGGKRTH